MNKKSTKGKKRLSKGPQKILEKRKLKSNGV